MGLKERVILFIEHSGLNKAEFERIVGLSNDAVNKMSDNTRKSTLDKISNIFPDLNINWLRTGEGEMLKTGSINIKGDTNIANSGSISGRINSNCDIEALYKKIQELEKENSELKNNLYEMSMTNGKLVLELSKLHRKK